jgi:hypothetical protein
MTVVVCYELVFAGSCVDHYIDLLCTCNSALQLAETITQTQMVSMLEDMFLRYTNGAPQLRAYLLEFLDDRALRALRLTSRVLHDVVDHHPDRMFDRLVVFAPWPDHRDARSLKTVIPFCRAITIKIGHKGQRTERRSPRSPENGQLNGSSRDAAERCPSARSRWRNIRQALSLSVSSSTNSSSSTPSSSAQFSTVTRSTNSSMLPASNQPSRQPAQLLWKSIFSRAQQLRDITIDVMGEPGWPGRTEVEDALVMVRVALETAQLPYARTIHLTPIHAMGIMHLRWSGFGAIGTDLGTAPKYDLWQNLHTLNIQLRNPFLKTRKLSESQQVMFKKVLYDYLRSFAATLKCLRFVWMDGDGPSPITLDLEPELVGHRRAIVWSVLEQVCLGNITLPHRTIELLPERTIKPDVRVRMLRSIHRYSMAVFGDEDAWVEVLLNYAPHGMARGRVNSQASSLYSQ